MFKYKQASQAHFLIFAKCETIHMLFGVFINYL